MEEGYTQLGTVLTAPAKPASAGMPAPRQHPDHNELPLP
jgi:hypothetical protein